MRPAFMAGMTLHTSTSVFSPSGYALWGRAPPCRKQASHFPKVFSHEGRLPILRHPISGEKSVTQLEALLSARQAAVSQQLARLRLEGLVTPRREGKAIYYRLSDDRPRRVIEVLYELFCDKAPPHSG